MSAPSSRPVVLAGATGDLGGRVAAALAAKGASVRALVRADGDPAKREALERLGVEPVPVDFDDPGSLARACEGVAVVVSTLNGLGPTIVGLQTRLAEAAVAAGVPRFVPSDYSLDYTKTRPGDNRNMDLRREFNERIDAMPIRATSILNGAFANLLTGGAPIVLRGPKRILYWGDGDQPTDFTTKDDTAAYTADVALDDRAPRLLRIAGDAKTPVELAALMTELTGERFKTLRAGGLGRLDLVIRVARTIAPRRDAIFPVWQGMQYVRDMASGRGKLDPLDNDRYGARRWTSARDVLAAHR